MSDLTAYSHFPGPGIRPGSMGSNRLCSNVQWSETGKEPGPIVFSSASPIPYTGPGPMQCEKVVIFKIHSPEQKC